MNWRPGNEKDIGQLDSDIDSGLWKAAEQVATWPSVDYFATDFPDTSPAVTARTPALVTHNGVVNAATFDRGMVPGSWVSLFGVNLSPTTRAWSTADMNGRQLPGILDGVSVLINGHAASVCYLSPGQVTVQVPDDLPRGWLTVELTNNAVTTGQVLANVATSSPGVFAYSDGGVLFAAATRSDGSAVSPANPASVGEVIALWATGVTNSQAGIQIASPRPVQEPVRVLLDGELAATQYVALVAPGLFQINMVVPAVQSGNRSVVLAANLQASAAGVYIPVR